MTVASSALLSPPRRQVTSPLCHLSTPTTLKHLIATTSAFGTSVKALVDEQIAVRAKKARALGALISGFFRRERRLTGEAVQ